ncbi:MAG: DUF3987 domain-containing protein [Adhaeribacter sp.]
MDSLELIWPALDAKVSMYEKAAAVKSLSDNYSAKDIVKKIKSGAYGTVTRNLRALSGDENDKYKRTKFYGVTWSGVFSPIRASGNLIQHSGLICLDIDKLSPSQLDVALSQIQADPFTLISFISPNGNGIKVVVRIDLQQPEQHLAFFCQLEAYYQESYGIRIDPTCKNVDRLCFLPCDEEIYVNPNSEVFQLPVAGTADDTVADVPGHKESGATQIMVKDHNYDAEIFEWCLRIHNKKHHFIKGGRNYYITVLGNFCNDYGITKEFCEAECVRRFSEPGFTANEIKATISSIYRKTNQHGIKSYTSRDQASIQPGHDPGMDPYSEADSPIVPPSVYNELPDMLHRMCMAFKTDREKDTFLTGALTVLSGCFPAVSGVYDGVAVYSNLFSFIVAPAATGKGAMGWAKRIAMGYHKALSGSQYEPSLMSCSDSSPVDGRIKVVGMDGAGDFPDRSLAMLFFPANSSGASMIQALRENGGKGIIFETEADTLSATLTQDWGNYSDMLRKAFHHEPITYMRKTNNEFLEIDHPQLSVCLSGTPGQVQRLIPNAEDGLFSRFIFYNFAIQPKWRSVGPHAGRVNLDEYFNPFQGEVLELINSINSVGIIGFSLKESHWNQLDNTFGTWLEEVSLSIGGNAGSAVKRLGLITFRIAMVLSIFRAAETGEIGEEMICTDTDFRIAMALAETYRCHSMAMFKKMPQESTGTRGHKISEKEEKYREACRLKEMGLSNRKIAERLAMTEGAIRYWFKGSA